MGKKGRKAVTFAADNDPSPANTENAPPRGAARRSTRAPRTTPATDAIFEDHVHSPSFAEKPCLAQPYGREPPAAVVTATVPVVLSAPNNKRKRSGGSDANPRKKRKTNSRAAEADTSVELDEVLGYRTCGKTGQYAGVILFTAKWKGYNDGREIEEPVADKELYEAMRTALIEELQTLKWTAARAKLATQHKDSRRKHKNGANRALPALYKDLVAGTSYPAVDGFQRADISFGPHVVPVICTPEHVALIPANAVAR